MASSKDEVTSFTQSWQKTVSWAKSQGIPYQAYYPVYQMDAKRMLTGYKMSEPERIAAIQASAGLSAPTQLPGDTPNPSNITGNITSNAWDLFTGLNPFGAGGGLIGNILDTIKNTVEHPSSVYGMVIGPDPKVNGKEVQGYWQKNLVNFEQHVLAPHSFWSLIPGMYDIAEAMRGKAGAAQLASTPLTTLLDVLPMGKLLPSLVADSEHGSAVAARLGTTVDKLRSMDAVQLSYRMAKSLPLPAILNKDGLVGFARDAHGNPIGIRPPTIAERINLFRNNKGMGSEQGDLLKGMIVKGDKGTQLVMARLDPIFKAIDSLNDEEKVAFARAIQSDVRPIADKLSDPDYTEPTKAALQLVHDYNKEMEQVKMVAGELVTIETQFGPETYGTKYGTGGATVYNALRASQTAQSVLDKASKLHDKLQYLVLSMDRKMAGAFNVVEADTAAVMGSVAKQLPTLDPTARARMAQTLGDPTLANPMMARWRAAVHQQTPLLRNLLGLPPDPDPASLRLFPTLPRGPRLTLHHINAIRDLFTPGGLLDSMTKAYKDHDWVAMSKYARSVKAKFAQNAFKDIPRNGPLFRIKQLADQIEGYAKERESLQNRIDKLMYGTKHGKLIGRGNFAKTSIANLTKQAVRAHDHFVHMALIHPPDVWSNIYTDLLVDRLMEHEKSAGVVEEASKYLSEQGFGDTIDKLRQDPRTLVELFIRASKDSFGNGMMPDIDIPLMKELQQDAYRELGNMRAMGMTPEYVPMISPFEAQRLAKEGMNVYVGSIRPKSISSTFGRAFEFNSSVYAIGYAMLKEAKDQITNDVVHEFFTEYFQQHLISAPEANQLAAVYIRPEIEALAQRTAETGIREKTVDALVREQIARMGYRTYDPGSIFGEGFSVPKLNGEYYIHENMERAAKEGVRQYQFPAQTIWDRGTKMFRFSILGLSPRYTAHILFGGTALLAYRGYPSMVRHLGAATHMFLHGTLPDHILERYPQAAEHMTTMAAQEGAADRLFHQASAYTAGNSLIRDYLVRHGMPADMPNWLKAAANLNMTFTRAVVRMQRAVVYLDGAARAERTGSFSELVPTQRLDANGEPELHPVTKRPIYDSKPVERTMTPEQAHHMGMEAVHSVMGELRSMTPLERQVFVRVFPFYGWTKHVLTYIFTYPVDHPYRAVFLSQLATQNSADIASGLPTRIQLLTFLGHPDEFGNVKAIDTRVFDPLRDTANYASMTGILQSLNPVITAPFVNADPNIVFGGNELYPNVAYNKVYGTKEAGPQGNLWNVAENFVPELTAADEAFNLSGHYAYLKSQGGNAFAKKLFESLNVPFFQVQTINVRQIAAQGEIDRYQQAAADALQAAQSGDMSSLSGYAPNAPVPYPLNPYYNTTPAYIAAMNQESESKYGLPMYATTPAPPNPPLL